MTETSAVIRPMELADLEPLSHVYAALYDILQVGEHWTPVSALRMLAYYFHNHPALAYCAECDGQLVGAFVSAAKPWWDGVHLFDGEIFVAQVFQHLGIGRQLLKAVFTAAKDKHQAVRWDFFTITGTPSPVAWYQKIGIDVPAGYAMMSGDLETALAKLG